MWPYWFLFVLVSLAALTQSIIIRQSNSAQVERQTALGPIWYWILVFLIGFRHEVGSDWFSYLEYINVARQQTFIEAVLYRDPAYQLINWFASRAFGDVYFVNILCGAIFAWGLIAFCRKIPQPVIALVVAVPYLVVVVAMGYSRQGVAIGISMWSLVALLNGRIGLFALAISFASLFHLSALVLLPFGILVTNKNRWIVMSTIILSIIVLYYFLFESLDDIVTTNYINRELESSGALIRIVMNSVPAIIFLIWRRYFIMPESDRLLWTYYSITALAFVILLQLSPSSTAVDRLALYWIPLQIVVFSYIANLYNDHGRPKIAWVILIIIYSASILFTWLSFALNAEDWVPYQFYLAKILSN